MSVWSRLLTNFPQDVRNLPFQLGLRVSGYFDMQDPDAQQNPAPQARCMVASTGGRSRAAGSRRRRAAAAAPPDNTSRYAPGSTAAAWTRPAAARAAEPASTSAGAASWRGRSERGGERVRQHRRLVPGGDDDRDRRGDRASWGRRRRTAPGIATRAASCATTSCTSPRWDRGWTSGCARCACSGCCARARPGPCVPKDAGRRRGRAEGGRPRNLGITRLARRGCEEA